MRFGRRKITYYDTEAGFEAEKFAARLLLLLMNEMRASGRRQVVFLCIGTDRSTGDSLGPLIGSRLEAEEIGDVVVIGTLEHPVHAVNLDRTMEDIEEYYPDAIIIAVDAAVGRWDHVGLVTLEKGPLRPGLGVRKELAAVGDISITGIVGGAESGDPLFCRASVCPWSCIWRIASAAVSVSECESSGDVSKTFPVRPHLFDMFCGRIMLYFGKNLSRRQPKSCTSMDFELAVRVNIRRSADRPKIE